MRRRTTGRTPRPRDLTDRVSPRGRAGSPRGLAGRLAAEVPLSAAARPRLLVDDETRHVDAKSQLMVPADHREVVIHLEGVVDRDPARRGGGRNVEARR